jgi:hypothetical protein
MRGSILTQSVITRRRTRLKQDAPALRTESAATEQRSGSEKWKGQLKAITAEVCVPVPAASRAAREKTLRRPSLLMPMHADVQVVSLAV